MVTPLFFVGTMLGLIGGCSAIAPTLKHTNAHSVGKLGHTSHVMLHFTSGSSTTPRNTSIYDNYVHRQAVSPQNSPITQ
jgi:hypothetical protein